LAFFYSRKKQKDKEEYYLLRAAISDVRGAIREENSLRELTMLLMEKGETDRAFRYLKTSHGGFRKMPLKRVSEPKVVLPIR